jgi:hypothetical protein
LQPAGWALPHGALDHAPAGSPGNGVHASLLIAEAVSLHRFAARSFRGYIREP